MHDAWTKLSEHCNEKISKLEQSERSELLQKLKLDLGVVVEQSDAIIKS